MGIDNVAIIYDDQVRPETTGVYCLRALRQLVTTRHLRPKELDGLRPGDFDLYVMVDDGLELQLPDAFEPAVWWAIDTHIRPSWYRQQAGRFDAVFTAQQDGWRALQNAADGRVEWLPLACDPEIHARHDVPKRLDVCFIGTVFPGPRQQLLDALRAAFPNTYVGRQYFRDMARIYSEARIVFNRSLKNDLNMRVFEALACGSLLVTNRIEENGQDQLFRDRQHLVCYSDKCDLLERVQHYLDHDDEREAIAEEGRREVLAQHTYRHRMEHLLNRASEWFASARARPAKPRTEKDLGGRSFSHRLITKDPFYFDFARPEVLDAVPIAARRVLDVGCGTGRLGESIKHRQDSRVVGVELDEYAAAEAAGRLDRVITADVERLDNTCFEPASFDTVILSDCLEHLTRPALMLATIRQWLHDEGHLVLSVPNVQHQSVITALIAGNWTYEMAGLLDDTHLHFFTRRTIERMLCAAGFRVQQVTALPGSGYREWSEHGCPGNFSVGSLCVEGLTTDEAQGFFVYQYLFVAVPNSSAQSAREATSSGCKTRSHQVSPYRAAGATDPTSKDACSRVTIDTLPQRQAAPKAGDLNSTDTIRDPWQPLRILLLGNFARSWHLESYWGEALALGGHRVTKRHELLITDTGRLIEELDSGDFDCLLFSKGRIGAASRSQILSPDSTALERLLENTQVPAYMWYVDRVLDYAFDRAREAWIGRVAPLCRVAFVSDGPLAQSDRARWHLLREGVAAQTVCPAYVAESDRRELAFVGQVYGQREAELEVLQCDFEVDVIQNVHGHQLSHALNSYKIVLGPRFPSVDGYWSNRLYLILGHGGFLLAPEIPGMREEGFVPGVHYAALGDDPANDVRHWLSRPEERWAVARQGQQFVLERHTLQQRVEEMCRVIRETLQ